MKSQTIDKKNIEDILPLSPIQSKILNSALSKKDSENQLWIEQVGFNLNYNLNVKLFQEAFQFVTKSNKMLRTIFHWEKIKSPIQIIKKVHSVRYFYHNLEDKEEQDEAIKVIKKNALKIKLSEVPFRVDVIKLSNEYFVFYLTFHHIIIDGWSTSIILNELFSKYAGDEKGKMFSSNVSDNFNKYVKFINSEQIKDYKDFWRKYTGVLEKITELPIAKKVNSEKGKYVHKPEILSNRFTSKLNDFLIENQTTVSNLLNCCLGLLLSYYNDSDNVAFGNISSGRSFKLKGINNIVGQFSFIFPYVLKIDRMKKVQQLIKQSQKILTQIITSECLYELGTKDFEKVDESILKVGIVIENYPVEQVLLTFKEYNISIHSIRENCPFDLLFYYLPFSSEIGVVYQPEAFNKESINRLLKNFTNILEEVVFYPKKKILDLNVLSQQEQKDLLNLTPNTSINEQKSIIHRFNENVNYWPDRVALSYQNRHLTYKELNHQSNIIAKLILKRKGHLNDVVGLLMNNTSEKIITILGVLKASCTYLPLDTNQPVNRITRIIKDGNPSLIIVDATTFENVNYTKLLEISANVVRPFRTPPRPINREFDKVPVPDRSLINYEIYNKYLSQAAVKDCLSVQGTRGCPYKCLYCHKIWPKTHVIRSAENIFDEVNSLYKLGVRRFAFIDDIFNINVKNSSRFFELVLKNKLDIKIFFPNGVRADILTKEYIDLMVEAGTVNIAFALETASPRIQKLIEKNLNLERFTECLNYICSTHPEVIIDLFSMHGFPTETEEEANLTRNFIKNTKWIDFPFIFILKIFPDTEMEKLALCCGIKQSEIQKSRSLTYHELPTTSPFDRKFTIAYQADILHNYFFSKERLLNVLPMQMKNMTEDELVMRYSSYLRNASFTTFTGLLEYFDISETEINPNSVLRNDLYTVPNLNEKLKNHYPAKGAKKSAIKVLLLDLSHPFKEEKSVFSDIVEAPLGLMYLLTYAKEKLVEDINGKVAKSNIDFKSFEELEQLISEFNPDIIGIRTLTIYKEFCHETVLHIRSFGCNTPVVVGGPYGTSDFTQILLDKNIDIVVLGEGEITFLELIQNFISNNNKIPNENVLKTIKGIAFIPKDEKKTGQRYDIVLSHSKKSMSDADEIQLPDQNTIENHKAYIMYTSGTTGFPKGSIVSQKSVYDVIVNQNYLNLSPNDRILQLSNYAFDGSVFDIFGSLLNGAGLNIISSKDSHISERISNAIIKENISVLFITTALFNSIVEHNIETFKNVKKILFGGEKVSTNHVKKAFNYLGKGRLIHMYGPTECTVFSSYHEILDIDKTLNTIPIGKAIRGTKLISLSSTLRLTPKGSKGELYIQKDEHSTGYLNNPEKTRERFISNPYEKGNIVYKTGDVVRILEDNSIEFIGRNDSQIKLRGYRIELDEIKKCILCFENVTNCEVLINSRDAGIDDIVSFISSNEQIDIDALKLFLKDNLPKYMIPHSLVQIDEFPFTPNGKIDKNRLLAKIKQINENYSDQKLPLIEEVKNVWSNVLNISPNELLHHTDFFDVGGHSISALKMVSMLSKKIDNKVNVSTIFEFPELINFVKKLKVDVTSNIKIQGAEKKEYYITSDEQRGILLATKFDDISIAYNMPFILQFNQGFDKSKIKDSLYKIIKNNTIYRTSFEIICDEFIQKIASEVDLKINEDEFDLTSNELIQMRDEIVINKWIKPFDLTKSPLINFTLIHCKDKVSLLLIDIHHIISDGYSIEKFLTDFNSILINPKANEISESHYPDYSEQQHYSKKSKKYQETKQFWINELNDNHASVTLPNDFQRGDIKTCDGDRQEIVIDGKVLNRIEKLANQNNLTLFNLLFGIYSVFLARVCKSSKVSIGTPVLGRDDLGSFNIAGPYAKLLCINCNISNEMGVLEYLHSVKQKISEAMQHQVSVESLVSFTNIKRDLNKSPLFDTMLSFEDYTNLQENNYQFNIWSLENKKQAKFDITLFASKRSDSLTLSFEYNTTLFKKSTIERFSEYLNKLIISLADEDFVNIKMSEFTIPVGFTKLEESNNRSEEVFNF